MSSMNNKDRTILSLINTFINNRDEIKLTANGGNKKYTNTTHIYNRGDNFVMVKTPIYLEVETGTGEKLRFIRDVDKESIEMIIKYRTDFYMQLFKENVDLFKACVLLKKYVPNLKKSDVKVLLENDLHPEERKYIDYISLDLVIELLYQKDKITYLRDIITNAILSRCDTDMSIDNKKNIARLRGSDMLKTSIFILNKNIPATTGILGINNNYIGDNMYNVSYIGSLSKTTIHIESPIFLKDYKTSISACGEGCTSITIS